MRYALILLLLAGCGSQSRDYYDDDEWEDYEPGPRSYYDENYKPPGRRTSAELLKRAAENEAAGRDDRARVEYHDLFRGDRWHHAANTRYQNLMLRNELDVQVWQEYLDLWESNPGRGDALWFHLRPLVLKYTGKAQTRGKVLNADELDMLALVLAEVAAQTSDSKALQIVMQALERHDWFELHRLRISLCPESALAEVSTEYAERAEEDPSDGNALALHALAVARTDMARALRMLRDGVVLGLPGQWLYQTLAEICEFQGDATSQGSFDGRRQAAGWYELAQAMQTQAGVLQSTEALQGKRKAIAEQGLDTAP